ncbi:BZ3500_MvSof-1268-A1-R1_Chr7-1g09326 [Microbotryum saponariae]|uniref:BZ3500_MvSof-1268-A1-R1_Chr7-1g09326 protein n=1 Tax=Microbotryum saponariae TaxID=289078 RepID=A0A2X0NDZ0_9BASI|nr:BZ3501_MvSof-1269-A2-R1_Chr7-1g09031 [Microbotryum saponariae]SDA03237.1 BZ3500_MvSof-1268-A1-R1_Chr7-1g09326 [Microbotryum saponariae]
MNYLPSTSTAHSPAQQARNKKISERRRHLAGGGADVPSRLQTRTSSGHHTPIDPTGPGWTPSTELLDLDLSSPSSSDFEHISASELADGPTLEMSSPASLGPHLSTASPQAASPFLEPRDSRGTRDGAWLPISAVPTQDRNTGLRTGDVADADDSEFSPHEDERRGRGRGRTKRREDDPTIRTTLIEDALRSSLAAPYQSLSPAMSHVSLTSLAFQSSSATPNEALRSPQRSFVNSAGVTSVFAGQPRPSPFAFALDDAFGEVDDDDDDLASSIASMRSQDSKHSMPGREAERYQSPSGEAIELSSLSSDEGTELAPRTAAQTTSGSAPALPTATRGHEADTRREQTQDLTQSRRDSTLPSAVTDPDFSPIRSRPLQLGPAPGSPPAPSNRGRRRGNRRGSASPLPASVEERRRARAARGSAEGLEGSIGNARVHRESTRGTRSPRPPAASFRQPGVGMASVRGLDLDTSARASECTPDRRPTPLTSAAMDDWDAKTTQDSISSSLVVSEPFLPSSAPTLDLSSSAEESPCRRTTDATGKGFSSTSGGSRERRMTQQSGGWYGFLGRSVELKVWQVVGLCGLLLGVGVGIAPYLRSPGRLGNKLLTIAW